jgi:hypothetical protein
MRTVASLSKVDTLKLVCFPYFHSVIVYGVIIWENSIDSEKVFTIQKEIIRTMTGVKTRVSFRELSKKFNIHPSVSEFLLSLLSFLAEDKRSSHRL